MGLPEHAATWLYLALSAAFFLKLGVLAHYFIVRRKPLPPPDENENVY